MLKQKIALLRLLQELTQGIQTLGKFIENETTEETNIKGKALVAAINLEPAKALMKGLSKGFEQCPFCEETVRQISSHIAQCSKVGVVNVKVMFPEEVKVEKVVEEVVVKKEEGPPIMKLICNTCKTKVEGNDEIFYRGFWETGIPCEKPNCYGRLISDMTPEELRSQKEYRATHARPNL